MAVASPAPSVALDLELATPCLRISGKLLPFAVGFDFDFANY